MPEISRFFGIVIRVFYNDHDPPHFHAEYASSRAIIGVGDLVVLGGSLPPRALGLVMEWASRHRSELLEDWDLARRLAPLKKIAPLE
jgi:hypothetical protein